jgi:hypothetical protein
MIALTLVRVIERHSNELASELVTKLETFPPPPTFAKFRSRNCAEKSRKSCSHLSECLLTKTGDDIEQCFLNWGSAARRKGSRSDFCWAIALIKEHLWEFRARASNEARLKFRPDGIAASAAPVS